MLDGHLVAAVDLLGQALQALRVSVRTFEELCTEMSVRPVSDRQGLCQLRADGYLEPLDKIEQEQSEISIEYVEAYSIVECRPWAKRMGVACTPILQREPIRAQPVVADVRKKSDRLGAVGDRQASGNQQIDLLFEGEGRL